MARLRGKIIGAGLGWAFGGPLGALLGGIIGNQFDTAADREGRGFQQGQVPPHAQQQQAGAFVVALLALFAQVSRADGQVTKQEVLHVKQWLVAKFGAGEASDMMQMYRKILQQEYDLASVTAQIKSNMDYYSRLELTRLLVEIAQSDNALHPSEIRVITQIAGHLGISTADLKSLFGVAGSTASSHNEYEVLGLSAGASDAEVKSRYRELVKKYHPDRVSHLGDEFAQLAQEKFVKLQTAWETISKERGI